MPIVDRGTHRLHWESTEPPTSEKPPLLLVMGMAFSSRAWDALPGVVADRYRVITFDNRGTGRSTISERFFHIHEMADDAAAVLDAAGAARAHVFGISLGGIVAMELALRHTQRIRSLVLGATFASYRESKKPELAIARTLLTSSLFGRDAPEHVAPVLVSDTADKARFADWLAKVERAPPRVVFRQMVAATRHASDGRLRELRTATLVVTGDRDRLVPPENSRALAALLPDAELVEIEGAGHVFPFEKPEETEHVVTEFLARNP